MAIDSRTSTMKPLLDDLNRYTEAYKAYAGFSERKLKVYEDWADKIFVRAGAEKLGQSFSEVGELKVLGVGSGSGEVDCCLLERLARIFPTIINTVVDPSSEMISNYAALVEKKEPLLPGVRCCFLQKTVQEFLESVKVGSAQKFHFIHAVQSLYYAGDLEGTVSDLYECLESGGVLLIILMTDEHVIYRVWDAFPFLTSGSNNLSSSDVTKILEHMGLAFTSYLQTWRTEMSSCADPESDEGNKNLDFLTHTVHFRDTAPVELQDRVISFLRLICPSDEEDSGTSTMVTNEIRPKLYFVRDWHSIFVVKR